MRTGLTNSCKLSTKRRFSTEKIQWIEPELAFETCFKTGQYAFWLDSSLPMSNGRYSFMGISEFVIEINQEREIWKKSPLQDCILSTQELDFFDFIEHELNQIGSIDSDIDIPFKGGFVGYLNYETKTEIGVDLRHRSTAYPTALFMWVEKFIAFDVITQSAILCSICLTISEEETWKTSIKQIIKERLSIKPTPSLVLKNDQNATKSLALTLNKSKENYLADIAKIKDLLNKGESYEVCLTNEFKIILQIDSFELYKALRAVNAAPYSAFIQLPHASFLSSSPECLVSIDTKGNVRSEPIKGTRSKGTTLEETAYWHNTLINSEKDNAELLIIIDLIRNDLNSFCKPGTVQVVDFKKVTEYATLLQLSSVIEGLLKENYSAVKALKSIFPGGSVTGAPKKRTMHIIDNLEGRTRGIYTGSIGYFSIDKAATFNIAIRTIVNDTLRNEVTFGSGGAIVTDSVPEEEYQEILVKAYPLIKAISSTIKNSSALKL